MKHVFVAITVCVLTNLSFATTNFQQGAGNAVSQNAEQTFNALIEACNDVSILGLRARARLEMNRSTEEGQQKIIELMDQGMATCGVGDIAKATELLNEAIAVGKASVTENFGTDASVEKEAQANDMSATKEESGPSIIVIVIGLVIIIGIVVIMRRRKTDVE